MLEGGDVFTKFLLLAIHQELSLLRDPNLGNKPGVLMLQRLVPRSDFHSLTRHVLEVTLRESKQMAHLTAIRLFQDDAVEHATQLLLR